VVPQGPGKTQASNAPGKQPATQNKPQSKAGPAEKRVRSDFDEPPAAPGAAAARPAGSRGEPESEPWCRRHDLHSIGFAFGTTRIGVD